MQKDLLIVVLLTFLMVSISYGIMKDCPTNQEETVELLTQRTMELEHEVQRLNAQLKTEQQKIKELQKETEQP